MAVAYVAGPEANTTLNSGVNSQTWSYNSGSGGANQVLFIMLSFSPTGIVSGVTYNGVAAVHGNNAPLSSVSSQVDFWYVVNPAIGANNLVVSWSTQTNQTGVLGAVVFSGADQTTPLGTAVGTGNPSIPSISIIIPTDGGGIDVGSSSGYLTTGNQTLLYANNTPYIGGLSQYSLSSGTQTFTIGPSPQGHIGYPINPAGGGGGFTPKSRRSNGPKIGSRQLIGVW